MNKITHYIINRHQDLLRFVIILIALLLVLVWIPKEEQFYYEYTKGRPWQYEDLIAPFDFAIQKSPEEIQKEKQELLADFVPYFTVNTTVAEETKTAFLSKLAIEFEENRYIRNSGRVTGRITITDTLGGRSVTRNIVADYDTYKKAGLALLEKVYSTGVIDKSEIPEEFQSAQSINLLRGNVSTRRKISSLYTVESAKEDILQSLENNKAIEEAFLYPILKDFIKVNIHYNSEITERLKTDLLSSISLTRGKVVKGQEIISKGSIVNDEQYQILLSLQQAYEGRNTDNRNKLIMTIGFILLCGLCFAILLIYLALFQKDIFKSIRKLSFILFSIVSFVYLTGSVLKIKEIINFDIPVYVVPLCMIPIILKAFFDTRTALFTFLVIILIDSIIIPNSFEFIFLNLTAGIFTIFISTKIYYRSQFYISVTIILLIYLLGYTGIVFTQYGSFDPFTNVNEPVILRNYGFLMGNALLTLLAFPLTSIFEKLFGLVSDITIFELSDPNKPLLKELQVKAPGTFQHSFQVANLAEAAASEIEANPLLSRVGALYHDIGKIYNPVFFIENQNVDMNPHDELSPQESTKIIIGHVLKGIELAKRKGLPENIIDFIRTHHGTTRVEYFYRAYVKQNPDENIDESKFRYPGPPPFSKETGIVMLADSVEASSKSLKNSTEEDIDNLVETIINQKISENQLDNCDITFKHISIIKKIFKKMLKSIYHVRISYPGEV